MSGPTLTTNSARCQCPVCREFFNSVYAFDKHRVGEHGVHRRCLTPAEMLARGMDKNRTGFWVSKKRTSWDGFPGPSWVIDGEERRHVTNAIEGCDQ